MCFDYSICDCDCDWSVTRAKYIIGTINALKSKPGGGEEWLRSLRKMELRDVISALCTLPGVGPKVAACIALFSLDQHHAVPVDTHVWRVSLQKVVIYSLLID